VQVEGGESVSDGVGWGEEALGWEKAVGKDGGRGERGRKKGEGKWGGGEEG